MIPANLSPLANHLWQSTLFVAAVWLLTVALRKNHAAIRYGLWVAASVKFLVPFSLLVGAGSQLGWRPTSTVGPIPMAHVVEQISRPFALPAEEVPALTTTASSNPVSLLLLVVWTCGFAVSAGVWMRLWWRHRAALRAATPLDWDLPVPVMSSPGSIEPGVFGIWKPILLLPAGILHRLTPEQLRSVVAHELCHVRRRDNLTASIHMLVESIFWFHPLVWWIGARMVEERERACDEEVVRLGNVPDVYAEGILTVCRFCLRSPLTCASGVTGAGLKKRIESIVNFRISHRLTTSRKILLAAAGVAVVAGPVLVGILNVPRSSEPSKVEPIASQRSPFEAIPEAPEPPSPDVSGPTIEAIEFRGTRRVPQSMLRAIVYSRAGGAYDEQTLRSDSQALYKTQRFSNVTWEAEQGPAGVIVRFDLVDRPVIQSIEYDDAGPVTLAEILERFKQREVQLKVATLFDEGELAPAVATLQDLLAERGRQNITVTALVEPTPAPSTVKITFRVEDRR